MPKFHKVVRDEKIWSESSKEGAGRIQYYYTEVKEETTSYREG